MSTHTGCLGAVLLFGLVGLSACQRNSEPAGFFVTSVGNPDGGNLGGLAGADAWCEESAAQAGLPDREWRAFLSTSGPIHARDRVGNGPWFNVAGDSVASDIDALIDGFDSGLMLDELGDHASRGAAPGPEHDILTGSDTSGRYAEDVGTCADWTSSSPDDRTRVGHLDWTSLPNDAWIQSWTSVHSAPCDPEGMARQLGTGRIYCFAAD